MMTLYGIPNCDSCRNARKFLDANNIEYRFHDVRADGVDRVMLEMWMQKIEWKALLNTRSATWRGLGDDQKSAVNRDQAIELMLTHPTLIKRPVVETDDTTLVGFSVERYAGFVK